MTSGIDDFGRPTPEAVAEIEACFDLEALPIHPTYRVTYAEADRG